MLGARVVGVLADMLGARVVWACSALGSLACIVAVGSQGVYPAERTRPSTRCARPGVWNLVMG